MSKKCKAYSESKLGLEPADNRKAFYAGWDAALADHIVDANKMVEQPAHQQEPVAKVIGTAPERIWLDLGFDPHVEGEIAFDDLSEVTWSRDNASGFGIEYVRADLAPASKPLTDEEIDMIYTGIRAVHHDIDSYVFARAIEAAHGIGEKK